MRLPAARTHIQPTIFNSLRARLIVIIAVAALLTTLIVSGLAISIYGSVVHDFSIVLDDTADDVSLQRGDRLADAAILIADRIDRFMKRSIDTVRLWAEMPNIVNVAQQAAVRADSLGLTGLTPREAEAQMGAEGFLVVGQQLSDYLGLLVDQTGFESLLITDIHGYNAIYQGNIDEFYHGDDAWWVATQANGMHVAHPETDTAHGTDSRWIAVRIDDPQRGTPLGVIVAEISLAEIQKIVQEETARIESSEAIVYNVSDGLRQADTGHDEGEEHNILLEAPVLADEFLIAAEIANLGPGETGSAALEMAQIPDSLRFVEGNVVTGFARSRGADLWADYPGVEPLNLGVIIIQPMSIALAALDGLRDKQATLIAEEQTITTTFVVIGVLTFGGAVIAAVWQAGLIVRPITHLQLVTHQLRTGDLAARAHVKVRGEIGALAENFNAMANDLQSMVEAERQSKQHLESAIQSYTTFVHDVANGDLRVRLDLQGMDMDGSDDRLYDLGLNLNRMVESLNSMATQVRTTAAAVAAASAQIQAAATQQTATVAQQDAAVNETVATVGHVRSAVFQAAERAQAVSDASQQSLHVSRGGQQAVSETIEGMETIRERVDSIAETILMLADRTQQIGEIINTVNEIASQSKLLALNASIEAARAGSEGKGFAVVAMEVRELAEQSREATQRVSEILNEIQRATNTAVMVTEAGSKVAEGGVVKAEQAGTSIRELTATIEQAADAATQIASSTHQQSHSMDQLMIAMAQIQQATAQTVIGIRQTEDGMHELLQLSRSLELAAARYEL